MLCDCIHSVAFAHGDMGWSVMRVIGVYPDFKHLLFIEDHINTFNC